MAWVEVDLPGKHGLWPHTVPHAATGWQCKSVALLILVPSVVVGWVLRPGQELAWGLKVGCPGGSQPGSFPAETGAGGLLAEGCVW